MTDDTRFTPPYDINAEAALIGALLINSDKYLDLPADLTRHSFYVQQHASIFSAISVVWNAHRNADVVSVANQMELDGTLESIRGREGLDALIASCPNELGIQAYAEIVTSLHLKRKMLEVAADVAAEAMNEQRTGQAVVDIATQKLLTLTGDRPGQPEASTVVVPRWAEMIQDKRENPEKYAFLRTPWDNINKIWDGLEPGDIIVVGGRPGMGKSAFVGDWRDGLASNGVPVGLFSLEMNEDELLARQCARLMNLDSRIIRKGQIPDDRMTEYVDVISRISQWPIYWDTSGVLSLNDAWRKMQMLVLRHDVQVMFVDYIQLMSYVNILTNAHAPRFNKATEIGEISRGLKMIAKQCHIPIVATAQLNRNVEHRDDKRPNLSDLRESGQIEQDASVVFFLYREGYYDANCDLPNVTEVIKAKDRNGEAPLTARLGFNAEATKFYDVEVFRHDLGTGEAVSAFDAALDENDDIGI
jgi:replicative DNA helicase